MALDTTSPSEIPINSGSQKTDYSQANLLASAYGDRSFMSSGKTDFAPESNIQIAAAFSAGIWNDARGVEQTMTDAPSAEAEVIKIGVYSNLAGSSPQKLWGIANSNVGRTDLGNRVPANAREHAGYKVPADVQCSSTLSDLMIQADLMSPRDYKIRVKDMTNFLSRNFGTPERLQGKFDPSDFPEGKIGIVSATGKYTDGTNHIALLERSGDTVSIVHNKNGRLVRENILDKFYSRDGRPRYSDMRLFTLGK